MASLRRKFADNTNYIKKLIEQILVLNLIENGAIVGTNGCTINPAAGGTGEEDDNIAYIL